MPCLLPDSGPTQCALDWVIGREPENELRVFQTLNEAFDDVRIWAFLQHNGTLEMPMNFATKSRFTHKLQMQ
ncbi:unnamed protein product [Symbiodinium sp. CCMP2592]|nr:unnamed protein product [Symbiodinium sp. CCMP2592]